MKILYKGEPIHGAPLFSKGSQTVNIFQKLKRYDFSLFFCNTLVFLKKYDFSAVLQL